MGKGITRPECAICGALKRLTSHHIHPQEYKHSYPNGPDAIDEEANLVIICQGCHSAVHQKKPYAHIVRDIKNKLRRGPRVRADHDDDQLAQSMIDQAIQREVWERLVRTLSNREACARVEGYRRIIRLIERLHKNQDAA